MEKTTLIVLAGGHSTRFGGDKLSLLVDGKPLATHILAAVDSLNFSARLLSPEIRAEPPPLRQPASE